MLSVTADTNIYISALNFPDGNPSKFLAQGRGGIIRLAVSDDILDEIADVLGRKFDWPERDIAEARMLIERFARKVKPTERLYVVRDDPDDDRILECASAARSDYIVTGDKHLLELKKFRDIPIIKVADFLGIMRASGTRGR